MIKLGCIMKNSNKKIKSFLNKIRYSNKNKMFDKSKCSQGCTNQNLSPYWDPEFSNSLETWGCGNAWDEIQFILCACSGKVLDIACGTGKVIEILKKHPKIDVYGCDISDFLINQAIKRGIPEPKLKICNATEMDYPKGFFNNAYSIGSLEHFTEKGIEKCISECHRVTKGVTFHLVPVSKSGLNEGWKTQNNQSFYNNNIDWWRGKFLIVYRNIIVLDSAWHDNISDGKWFICFR